MVLNSTYTLRKYGYLGPSIVSTIQGQNILEDTCTQQVCMLLLMYPAQKVAGQDSILLLSSGGSKMLTHLAEPPPVLKGSISTASYKIHSHSLDPSKWGNGENIGSEKIMLQYHNI